MRYYEFIGKDNGVRQRLYKKILSHFFGVMWKMIYDGHRIILPHRLGSLELKTGKTPFNDIKKMKVDYAESRKMWAENPELSGKQAVYFTNQHTNGYYIFLKHSLKNLGTRTTQIYKIHAGDTQKKKYSELFKNGKQY